jgi:hypothetical protein
VWCDDYTDVKVAMEVTALSLIHNRTTIPFIIMDVINGVSLSDHLEDPNAKRPTRLTREDINDSDIEIMCRQLANFSASALQARY